MASFVYNKAKEALLNGTLSWLSADLKVMLVTSGYSEDKDHSFVSEANSWELSGGGYGGGFNGAGRITIPTRTVQKDDVNDRGEGHGDKVEWTGLTAADVAAAIIVLENTNDGDSLLVGFIDDGGFPFSLTGGNFDVTPNIQGWLHLT